MIENTCRFSKRILILLMVWPTLVTGQALGFEEERHLSNSALHLFCYAPDTLYVAYVDGRLEVGTLGIATELIGNEIDLLCTHPLYDILDMNANASEPWVSSTSYCFIAGEKLKNNTPSCKLDPVRRLPPITPTMEQLRHRHYKWEELDEHEEAAEGK